MRMTLRDVEHCLQGGPETAPEEDRVIGAVRTDSRAVGDGDVFFCVEGERFDGHNFAAGADASGAVAVVASRMLPEVKRAKVFMVPDTVRSLGRLAACMRARTEARVIGVTGTAGKTTVKELLAAVLSPSLPVAKNARNFNNQIGLPLSMLAAPDEARAWVMEVGISKAHDMGELAPVLRPDVAVITNIGPGHLQGLGNVRGVARHKASLLRHLAEDGLALVNRDYAELWEEATAILPNVVGFSGIDSEATYSCRFLGVKPGGAGRFAFHSPEGELEAVLPYCSEHFAENFAAVTAVADAFGIGLRAVADRLAAAKLPDQRFICRACGTWTVIDDTYNANPLSMRRAVEAASRMAEGAPLVLVLGDMGELGPEAAALHEELGRAVAETAPAAVLYRGERAADVRRGLGDAVPLVPVQTADTFRSAWRNLGLDRGVVLVKGSRAQRMEEFVPIVTGETTKTGGGRA